MEEEDYLNFIKSRKSVRRFIYKKISNETIREILEAGRWAPSGQNNQPWRVNLVAQPTIKRMLAELTKYGGIIDSAFVNLVVFYDIEKGYNRVKDILACGAFMQNILLGVSAINKGGENIGAVWLGEILNNSEKVNELFKLSNDKFELMGVISIGYIDEQAEKKSESTRERREVDDFIDWF